MEMAYQQRIADLEMQLGVMRQNLLQLAPCCNGAGRAIIDPSDLQVGKKWFGKRERVCQQEIHLNRSSTSLLFLCMPNPNQLDLSLVFHWPHLYFCEREMTFTDLSIIILYVWHLQMLPFLWKRYDIHKFINVHVTFFFIICLFFCQNSELGQELVLFLSKIILSIFWLELADLYWSPRHERGGQIEPTQQLATLHRLFLSSGKVILYGKISLFLYVCWPVFPCRLWHPLKSIRVLYQVTWSN